MTLNRQKLLRRSSGKPDNPLVNDMDPVVLRLISIKMPRSKSDTRYIIGERAVLPKIFSRILLLGHLSEVTKKLKSARKPLSKNSEDMWCPSSCRKTYVFSHLPLLTDMAREDEPRWEKTHKILFPHLTWVKWYIFVLLSCHVHIHWLWDDFGMTLIKNQARKMAKCKSFKNLSSGYFAEPVH